MKRRTLLQSIAAAPIVSAPFVHTAHAQAITLHGAVQFNDDHAFNRALLKFEELVKKYYGKPINFVLHRNSELGLEKQYFEYMAQGKAVDYGIVSPAHMSTFSKAAPFIDAPFLFRDLDALEQGARRRPAQADRRRGGQERRGDADRLRRRRHAQHLRQQAGAQPGRDEGPEGARAGRADLEPDLQRDRHEPDRDRLQRGLQRDPEQRHRGRRERGRRRRGDEVLRSRAAAGDDAARDHDPADLLLRQDLRQAAQGPAGRGRQGRQGSRRLRPPDRERGRRRPSSWRWRRPTSSSACRSPTATR